MIKVKNYVAVLSFADFKKITADHKISKRTRRLFVNIETKREGGTPAIEFFLFDPKRVYFEKQRMRDAVSRTVGVIMARGKQKINLPFSIVKQIAGAPFHNDERVVMRSSVDGFVRIVAGETHYKIKTIETPEFTDEAYL